MNIAILTPSQNPYSETFIQAHKQYLSGKVYYYYGRGEAICLEGVGSLVRQWKRLYFKAIAKLFKKPSGYARDRMLQTSFKHNKIDVVLVEYGTHAYDLKSFLVSIDKPVVVHFHGFDASKKNVIARCGNYKAVFKLSAKVVAVSKVMEATLLKLGCPKDKLIYNVYGPQPEFETVNPTFVKKQFIGIGRFTDKKAPYYTIMAFKEVVDKYPDAKLLLAGDGVLLNVCQNLVNQYRLEKQVQFLGVITPEVYRNLLSESLAFVQHSIKADNGDMEGTPLAVLEASVAGLPVIATNHAGIPDVIVDGKTGLLCDEHDVKTMALNMQKLLEDKEYAIKLGRVGKQHILSYFSIKRHISVLQDTLEAVVKKY